MWTIDPPDFTNLVIGNPRDSCVCLKTLRRQKSQEIPSRFSVWSQPLTAWDLGNIGKGIRLEFPTESNRAWKIHEN